jgi:hypothetical protein
MNQDLQHLKLLSIFYYVVGGLLALVACIPIIHFIVGVVMVAAPNTMSGGGGNPPPAVVGWIFVLVAGSIILVGWLWAACLVAAGWFLGRRKHYIFCLIVGCSALLFQPLGTVLGVFTIIVLIRPSVKRLFETGGSPDEPPETDETGYRPDDHVLRPTRDIRAVRPG